MSDEKRKIDELDRRVKKLEKQANDFSVNYYEIKKEGIASANLHTFNFKLTAYNDCFVKMCVKVDTDCEDYFLKLRLNGVDAFVENQNKNALVSRALPLIQGENKIEVILSSASPFIVNECFLSCSGAVNYAQSEVILSVLNEESRSIILFSYDGEIWIKRYIGGLLENIAFIKGGGAAAFCKLNSNYAVFYTDEYKTLKIRIYDKDFTLKNEETIDDCVSSVCAIGGTECEAYAVKGNRVYRYFIDGALNVVSAITNITAKSVRCNPDVKGLIIITDFNGNDKLVSV